MESIFLSQAQSHYLLAQKAGLLTTETFSDVYTKDKLIELSNQLDADKTIFLTNNQDLSDPEKNWEEGIAFRIKEDTLQVLIDFLQNIDKSFMISYDQPVEDIVHNFKTVCSALDISATGEKQQDGIWYETMKIGDEAFQYKVDQDFVVADVLHEISRHLSPISKVILCSGTADGNQYIVIDSDYRSEFENIGFFEP